MSCREEQDFAAAVIDSIKFAADGDCMIGKLALSELPRLADVLAEDAGWLKCELTGYRDTGVRAGMLGLHLRVTGRVGLRCQRCLAVVAFECAINSRLLLMPPCAREADWPEDELESDDYDAIPSSQELSVRALIEDEILLALPIVPRHADCVLFGVTEVAEESEPSPFAVLAGLKKH
jgi:uncharacterized protein